MNCIFARGWGDEKGTVRAIRGGNLPFSPIEGEGGGGRPFPRRSSEGPEKRVVFFAGVWLEKKRGGEGPVYHQKKSCEENPFPSKAPEDKKKAWCEGSHHSRRGGSGVSIPGFKGARGWANFSEIRPLRRHMHRGPGEGWEEESVF